MTINIDNLTIGEAREIAGMFTKKHQEEVSDNGAWILGSSYLIRTVTMINTGKLFAVTPHELVLTDAAWIADTGRFADALKTGNFNEIEPFPDGVVIIGRGAIVDACPIKFPLPRVQK
jgi:hypothetical protein